MLLKWSEILPKCSQNNIKIVKKSSQNDPKGIPGRGSEQVSKKYQQMTLGIIDLGPFFGQKSVKMPSKKS